MKTLYALILSLFAFTALAQPPPIQRNVITTNTPAVVTFGGLAQVNDTILGWDTIDNKFVDFQIGANLTYTHATHTLSGSAGGSGVSIASIYTGMLSTNGPGTLVTITNIPAESVSGALTNNTSGNASTATKALFVDSILTNSIPGTNLTGTFIGAGLTMNTARILGRTTAGVGQVEELSAGAGVTIAGGQISATGSQTPWLQDIDAAGYSATNGGKLRFTNFVSAVQGAGSTNNASGSGASIFGASFANSTNDATGVGSTIIGVATNTGWNLASGMSSVVIGRADSSSNIASGYGSSVIGNATNGSWNVASGTGARVVGTSSDSSTNQASGANSLLTGTTLGGGLSRVSGAGSMLFTEVTSAGGGNLVSDTASFGLMLSSGGTNDIQAGTAHQLNQLFGVAQNAAGRNQISSGSIGLIGSRLFGYANLGTNLLTSSGSAGVGGLMFASTVAGLSTLNQGVTGPSMMFSASAAGTNIVAGNSSIGLMTSLTSGSLNSFSGSSSMMLASVGSGGGSNVVNSTSSMLIGTALSGGLNNMTGAGFLFGYASGGTNQLTGTGSMLFGVADSTIGSLVSTGNRSFTFGSGGTNVASDSFAYYSRGAPLIFAKTNVVGINTDTPRSTLDVNGASTFASFKTNEQLTANTIMGVDGGKREVSVALSGLTFDGTTLTATGDGGVSVASSFPGMLSTNPATLVTITGIPPASIYGTLTNDTTGNAATSTRATGANNATNFWGLLSLTNLPVTVDTNNGAHTSQVVQVGNGGRGMTNSAMTIDSVGNVAGISVPSTNLASATLQSLSTNNGATLTNTLGSVYQVDGIDAGALRQGYTNLASASPVTNYPTAGVGQDAWQFSVTATNGVLGSVQVPPSWNSNAVVFKLVFMGGTNAATASTNIIQMSAARSGAAQGTAVRWTNTLSMVLNDQTIFTSPPLTIGGSPSINQKVDFEVRVCGGAAGFTITNTLSLVSLNLYWTKNQFEIAAP